MAIDPLKLNGMNWAYGCDSVAVGRNRIEKSYAVVPLPLRWGRLGYEKDQLQPWESRSTCSSRMAGMYS